MIRAFRPLRITPRHRACVVHGVFYPVGARPTPGDGCPPGSSRSRQGGNELARASDVKGPPWAVQRVRGP